LSWREEKKKGIAVKEEDDLVPIKYEGQSGWYTVGRAITTRTTDEAKGWKKELANYSNGLTNKKMVGYQYQTSDSFPLPLNVFGFQNTRKG